MLTITVAQDGSGDFASVSEAVLAVPYACAAEIRIGPGVYREKLVCEKQDITLIGAGMESTRIVWGDGGKLPHPDGRPTHTFRSYTAFFRGIELRVQDLTIENDAGPGAKVGQAVAAYVDCSHTLFENVRLLGNQDTLFCAPLPEKEREKDGRVRVVDLSRNFGHHLAMYVACEEARGERVFLIDSDLEESPEWLVDFSREMDSTGADVVYGVQEKRKGGLFEAVSGELFYTLFNLLSDQQITRNMVTARLMSARFLREMLKFQDREPFFFGLCVSAGFRQVPCRVKKASSSPTTYTFRKKMALAVNSVVSYSARPLVYISYFGLAVTLVAMLYVAWVVVRQLLYNVAPPGWASSVASIWLVGGLILMSLGVIGIYISKIYKETKHRPAVVVARRYE